MKLTAKKIEEIKFLFLSPDDWRTLPDLIKGRISIQEQRLLEKVEVFGWAKPTRNAHYNYRGYLKKLKDSLEKEAANVDFYENRLRNIFLP